MTTKPYKSTNISTYNNRHDIIVASGLWSGSFEMSHESIAITVYSSTIGQLKVFWSHNKTDVDFIDYFDIPSAEETYTAVEQKADYFKVTFLNNTLVDQTYFRLTTYLRENGAGLLKELKTQNSHLDNIENHLTQNGDGTGISHGILMDSVASSLNDMKQHTNLAASRLNNIQNHLTQFGDGTGISHGILLDSCASRLGDISSNSSLTASRLNNVQNHLTSIVALSTPQGSQANLMSAVSCVAAGTESSVVDFGATSVPNKIQILCAATSSVSGSGYEIYGSIDNSNWCVVMMFNGSKTIPLSTSNSAGGTINSQSSFICDWCCRYVKIKVYCLATFNATVVGLGR